MWLPIPPLVYGERVTRRAQQSTSFFFRFTFRLPPGCVGSRATSNLVALKLIRGMLIEAGSWCVGIYQRIPSSRHLVSCSMHRYTCTHIPRARHPLYRLRGGGVVVVLGLRFLWSLIDFFSGLCVYTFDDEYRAADRDSKLPVVRYFFPETFAQTPAKILRPNAHTTICVTK